MASDTLSGAQRQPIRAGLSPRSDRVALTPCDCTSSGCLVDELDLCVGMRKKATSGPDWSIDVSRFTSSSTHTIPARRTIIHPKESSEFVLIICHGWAMRSIIAPDGHRQILSFLLPGNLISTASLFEPMSGHFVETLTKVTYRKFKRSDLKPVLFECPALLEKLSVAWIDERAQADQLALNLSNRSGDKRIAWLFLNLAKRLAEHGMVIGQKMDFPLRQRHVAYATGLTPRSCRQGAGRVSEGRPNRD